jgi:hypothetical protein
MGFWRDWRPEQHMRLTRKSSAARMCPTDACIIFCALPGSDGRLAYRTHDTHIHDTTRHTRHTTRHDTRHGVELRFGECGREVRRGYLWRSKKMKSSGSFR